MKVYLDDVLDKDILTHNLIDFVLCLRSLNYKIKKCYYQKDKYADEFNIENETNLSYIEIGRILSDEKKAVFIKILDLINKINRQLGKKKHNSYEFLAWMFFYEENQNPTKFILYENLCKKICELQYDAHLWCVMETDEYAEIIKTCNINADVLNFKINRVIDFWKR